MEPEFAGDVGEFADHHVLSVNGTKASWEIPLVFKALCDRFPALRIIWHFEYIPSKVFPDEVAHSWDDSADG